VNLLKKEKDKFIFHLPKREKQLLLAVLSRYPLIPTRHQLLSKTAASTQDEANQRLLDEALAEHRQQNRRQLKILLEDTPHFKKADAGWHMVLTGAEVEWLLQVLNDVRVGSWIILGAPEQDLWDFELSEKSAPHAWAMEIAGWYEATLLEALNQDHTT
jgi:hypothetical protein